MPGESKSDAAGTAGDEHVAVFDWDLDGAGTDEKVEEEEEEGGREGKENPLTEVLRSGELRLEREREDVERTGGCGILKRGYEGIVPLALTSAIYLINYSGACLYAVAPFINRSAFPLPHHMGSWCRLHYGMDGRRIFSRLVEMLVIISGLFHGAYLHGLVLLNKCRKIFTSSSLAHGIYLNAFLSRRIVSI